MYYTDIYGASLVNGEGIRTVLFVSGCRHHCKECQNEALQDPKYGNLFDKEAEHRFLQLARRTVMDGITLSGGDPLYEQNRDTMLELCKKYKDLCPEKTIWMYTGYTYEEVKDALVLSYVDVLVDGPYVASLSDGKPLRGSSNQRILQLNKGIIVGEIKV